MPAKTNNVDAIWNRGELDPADELFAADDVNHNGLIPDVVRGPEVIKISVVLYRLAFPDLHIVVQELSTNGEMVVLHWIARTQCPDGVGANTPSTDRIIHRGITRTSVIDGKVAEAGPSGTESSVYMNLSGGSRNVIPALRPLQDNCDLQPHDKTS